MLVLTRKAGGADTSTITVGEGVEVTIIEVKGDQVRLGITAPPDVAVHRKEVYLLRKAAEAENAAGIANRKEEV